MACTLRAGGKHFDIDAFMSKTKLKPTAIFRKGELRASNDPKSKKRTHSGINVSVSNAPFENFKRQVSDAIQFLIKNKTEIRKLTRHKGVEGVELDFATARERDAFLQEYIFPAELIALASKLGLEIRLSAYPPSDK
jgi:Domain of unknown function (DUF4279)